MPPSPTQPVLRLEKITKSFQEGERTRTVLQEVTAEFDHGQFIVLLGPSGSGKSTLLNLACGIEEPTSGEVIVDGRAITRFRDRERTLYRRDHIGFIFQFFNLIPTLTVLENVILPQELAGKSAAEVTPNALALLGKVGLADRRDTFPDKLSGGEQQRVAIARALAHNPMLILADEPTGNLDEKTGQIVLELLLTLTRDMGKTLIMATHSPDIAHLADRVVVVDNGRLVERGRGAEEQASKGD
ncbi:MAG: ABC transporter ATP-binding protein [Chloroflexi bacterium]|nr:ABC transporter ATP-binding protein [Chloroflexota bacterium]